MVNIPMQQSPNLSRRQLLFTGLTVAACSVVSSPALAAVQQVAKSKGQRVISFHNLHTDERLQVAYWRGGKYDRAALAKINRILRDHYSGAVHSMDPRLIDLVYDLQHRVGNDRAVEIVSGYRSPATNMRLASYSDGVATKSYHMRGMAMDLRMSGTSLSKIHRTALGMRRGGVGYYPDSQFVHVDVGPLRSWG